MDLKSVGKYLLSLRGLLPASSLLFPFADNLLRIVYIPATSEQGRFALTTLNSLICCFVLYVCYAVRSPRRGVSVAVFLFMLGIGVFLWYQSLTSPLQAFQAMGIRADLTAMLGYPDWLYQALYCTIFASLTGAFTSLTASSYRPLTIAGWGG